MSRVVPVVSSVSPQLVSRKQWLSTQRWRALALDQQRLRWVECGRRVAARMDAAGYKGHQQSSDSLRLSGHAF